MSMFEDKDFELLIGSSTAGNACSMQGDKYAPFLCSCIFRILRRVWQQQVAFQNMNLSI
jgi:hypothetical protein